MIGRAVHVARAAGVRAAAAVIAAVVLFAIAGVAVAYYAVAGSGSATGHVTTLSAPTLSAPGLSGHSATLTWSAVTPPSGAVSGYYVLRGGSAVSGCGSAAAPISATSCVDTVPTSASPASESYSVVAVWRSWSAASASSLLSVPGTQSVAFTSSVPTSAVVGGATYTPVASGGGSGNAVQVTVDATSSAVCSISGGVVSFTAVGTCTLDANQAGNANYTAAAQVQQSFSVGKGAQTVSFTSTAPSSAVVGGTTYTAAASSSVGLTPTVTVDATSSAVCSISGGVVSFTAAGTCTLDANQAGNANYTAAAQVQQSFSVGKGAQTVSFTSTAPSSATYAGATYTVAASATSTLTPTVTVDAASSAVCAISGSVVSFTGVGTCTLDANQAGNANYAAAAQVQQGFSVGKGAQTVSFTSTAPSSAVVGGTTYTAAASATSGLAASITSATTSVCTVSGAVVSFTAAGTCTLDANQAGNANYTAATQVQQSFSVGKGAQTASFTSTAPSSAVVGGTTYTAAATATSGLTPAVTVDSTSSAVCAISGSVVSFTGVGTCTLDANQAGNANYTAAAQVQQSFSVGKGAQTVSFTSTAPSSAVVGGATYTAAASSSVGLTPTLTVDSTSSAVCSISGSVVSFTAAGTCTLDANQAGNANYTAAAQVQQSFSVGKGAQTVSFTSTAPSETYGALTTYTPTATATSGLTPTITVDSSASSVCSISGSTVTFLTAGSCVLDANQAGNTNYAAATQVQQTVTVAKASTTTTLTSNMATPGANQTVTFTATVSNSAATGSVTFKNGSTVISGMSCTLSGGTCSATTTFASNGSNTITAIYAGDTNDAASTSSGVTETVQTADAISTLTASPSSTTYGSGVTFSATVATHPGPGKSMTVTFSQAGATLGTCTINDPGTSCTSASITSLPVGTDTVTAITSAVGTTYGQSAKTVTVTVAQASQTVSFTSSAPTETYGALTTYTPTATATSGLAPTITVDASSSSVCAISGGVVTFSAVGSCVLDANQAGSADYTAATQAQQTVTVNKTAQTVSFTSSAPTETYGALATYTPTATATSGLTPTITVDASSSSVCSISGGVVTFTAVGSCVLDANQAGNTTYAAATQAQQTVTVNKASQTISVTSSAPGYIYHGSTTYTPTATATSGLTVAITIDSSSSSVCSISSDKVSFAKSGTCLVDYNQAGNTNYAAAAQVQESLTVH